jgi:hypothetical protein
VLRHIVLRSFLETLKILLWDVLHAVVVLSALVAGLHFSGVLPTLARMIPPPPRPWLPDVRGWACTLVDCKKIMHI